MHLRSSHLFANKLALLYSCSRPRHLFDPNLPLVPLLDSQTHLDSLELLPRLVRLLVIGPRIDFRSGLRIRSWGCGVPRTNGSRPRVDNGADWVRLIPLPIPTKQLHRFTVSLEDNEEACLVRFPRDRVCVIGDFGLEVSHVVDEHCQIE